MQLYTKILLMNSTSLKLHGMTSWTQTWGKKFSWFFLGFFFIILWWVLVFNKLTVVKKKSKTESSVIALILFW